MPRTHQAGARPDSGTALMRSLIVVLSSPPPFTSIRAVLDASKQQYPIVPEIHFATLLDDDVAGHPGAHRDNSSRK
jgi:hypothetical protein